MLRHVHVLLATKCILRKEGKISMLEQQQQEIQQSNATIPNNRKYHNTRRLNTRKLFDFYLYTHTCIQCSPPGEYCSPSVSLPLCLYCICWASVKVQVLYHIRSIHEHLKTFVPFYWLMPMTTYSSPEQASSVHVSAYKSQCGLCGTNPPENHHQPVSPTLSSFLARPNGGGGSGGNTWAVISFSFLSSAQFFTNHPSELMLMKYLIQQLKNWLCLVLLLHFGEGDKELCFNASVFLFSSRQLWQK